MATKKYLVTLRPHDKFFFGGKNTFGDGNKANYFVKSGYFPQQTGILGLIRHQLLLQCNDDKIFKGNSIQSEDNASELIGGSGFIVKNERNNFGKIQNVSPVFIRDLKAKKNYFPANREYQIYTKLVKECKKEKVNDFFEIQLNDNPLLKDYEPKEDLLDLLADKDLNKLKYDEVFKEYQQVGIIKNYEGGTDDEAYYLQTFIRFNNKDEKGNIRHDYTFALLVELDDSAIFASQEVVVFGGEQQTFKMYVKEIKDENKNLDTVFQEMLPDYQKSENSSKIVLVSDAYIPGDILSECRFAITETVNFRFIKQDTQKGYNYYKRPNKSKNYELYKKNSVFYTEKLDEVAKNYIDNANFRQIGYNYYKIIKNN